MRTTRKKARALTLAEVLVSLVIMAVAMTAGVQSLGSFAAGSRAWQERSVAQSLAAQLLSEINALPFEDPAGNPAIGRDPWEVTGNRYTYDDIDDYDGWDASPPQDSAGNAMDAFSGYRQRVSVAFDTTLATKTGLVFTAGSAKKITVTVLRNDQPLARLVMVRTQHQAAK